MTESPLMMIIALVLIITAACVFVLLFVENRRFRSMLADQDRRLADLQAMLSAFGQSVIGMDARLESLESRIAGFTRQNLEIQSRYAIHQSFEEAARLLRDGASSELLVSRCGLTPDEAALMIRLHTAQSPRGRRQSHHAVLDPGYPANPDHGADATAVENAAPPPDAAIGTPREEIRLKEALRTARAG